MVAERRHHTSFAIDSSYDPAPYLETINVPMFYVFGETDVNVPTEQSVAFLEKFREKYDKDISYVVLDGVGHSLMHWTGVLTGGYLPQYLDIVESWTAEQVR